MSNDNFRAFVWLGLFGLSTSVFWTESHAVEHGVVHYDPSKYSTDPHGMAYFAVGRRVFRQPMDNIIYITGSLNDPSYPAPPDPSQPVGCPDHPFPGGSYSLSRMSAMLGDQPRPFSQYAVHVSLIINDAPWASTQDGLFDLQSKTLGTKNDSAPGFVGTGKNIPQDSYSSYKSIEYKTPNEENLTIACHDEIKYNLDRTTSKITVCQYGYVMSDHLAFSTGFVTANVPLADIIKTDLEIRRRVEAAQVNNFYWPDSHATNRADIMR